jgi:hypothetical protein
MRNAPGASAGGHKRKPRGQTSVKSAREYRVTCTWPRQPDKIVRFDVPDRARARKIGREWADKGAHETVAEHQQFGTYRVVAEYDGPALIADRAATARATQAAADARVRAELTRRAQERQEGMRVARDRAQAAALMVQPPVPRAQQQRARHTAGGR